LSNLLAPFMSQVTGLSSALAPLAAGLAIFLGVFIVITVITSTLAKTAHQSTEIGSFDRAAGLAFGVLRGVLVVALPLVLLRQGPDGPETIRPPADPVQCRAAFDELRAPIFCARSYPIYGVTAAVLERLIPIIGQRFGDTIERRRGESATIPPAEAGSAQSPASGAPAQQK
jgi:membrane protein required for colicin V production